MSIDVNTAFATERAAQITAATEWNAGAADRLAAQKADFDRRLAEGKIRANGNGIYTITDPGSWDNGETWTIRYTAGQLMPMPQHGLDESTGQAAIYSAAPMWHQLGSYIPGGVRDIPTVLELGGAAFEVGKRPALYRNPVTGSVDEVPGQFVTSRDDTGAALGVVGSRYTVFQNADALSFLDELVQMEDGAVYESCGVLAGGSTVFASVKLPGHVTVDPAGIADDIVPFVMFRNTHDGSGMFQAFVTPWRPICGNTERFAVRDAHTRWGVRHTKNGLERVDEARRSLKLASKYFDQWAADADALARTAVTLRDFDDTMVSLFGERPEPSATVKGDGDGRACSIWDNRRDALYSLWASNSESLGKTAYAAERAFTEWADWKSSVRAGNRTESVARATLVLDGDRDDMKTKARRQLLTLTNR